MVTDVPELGMDTKDTRRLRLRKLIDERFDGVVARLAQRLDMKPPQVHRWLSGKQGIHEDSARAIEQKVGIEANWLDLPLGLLESAILDAPPAEPATPSDDDYALVPQYSARAACGPAYHNGHVEIKGGLAFKRDWLARLGLKPDRLSVIAADGDSMSPTLQDSEVLLIDHSQIEPRDGKVFALAKGDELVVKRLVRDFSGGWVVRSDNPDKTRYPDFSVDSNTLRIVGRIVWHGGGL